MSGTFTSRSLSLAFNVDWTHMDKTQKTRNYLQIDTTHTSTFTKQIPTVFWADFLKKGLTWFDLLLYLVSNLIKTLFIFLQSSSRSVSFLQYSVWETAPSSFYLCWFVVNHPWENRTCCILCQKRRHIWWLQNSPATWKQPVRRKDPSSLCVTCLSELLMKP